MIDIEKELALYVESAEYKYDCSAITNECELFGEGIPNDDQVKELARALHRKWLENRQICEVEGHKWSEENVDGENGCNDLYCERCGLSEHIQW